MKEDFSELINGYKQSLNRKEAVFQVNFLIKKESYKNAFEILKAYGLTIDDLSSCNLSQKYYEKFMAYIKKNSL